MKQIPDTARRHHVNRASPVRRPALPRAQPIRNFGGVFGASPKSARPRGSEQDRPVGPDKGRAPKAGAGKGAGGGTKKGTPLSAPAATVARGVNAGYRVIEEYLRQGQEFARSLWPGATGARSPGEGGTVEAPLNMTERLVRSASDLAALFAEFLQTFSLPGTLPAPGSTPIPDFGIGRQPSSATDAHRNPARGTGPADAASGSGRPGEATDGATTISIDLRSRRRTTVTAFVQPGGWQPGGWNDRLQVHELRSLTGEAKAAQLTGVTATGIAADRRIVIAVDVPDSLPAGTYSGLIVDADSNLPRGTLSVQVFTGPPPRSPRQAARK